MISMRTHIYATTTLDLPVIFPWSQVKEGTTGFLCIAMMRRLMTCAMRATLGERVGRVGIQYLQRPLALQAIPTPLALTMSILVNGDTKAVYEHVVKDAHGMQGLEKLTRLMATARELTESWTATLDVLADAARSHDRLELELVGASGGLEPRPARGVGEQLEGLMEGILLMGVPKSKVSPSRKRMKHLQHVPDPVNWYKCTRCGEPKRPHRICTAHMDICALSDEDYAARSGKNSSSSDSSSSGST